MISKPECNMPTRMFLGVENASIILRKCAQHRVVYLIGFMTIVTIVLIIGYEFTKKNSTNDFHVPPWILFLPAIYVIFFAFNSFNNLKSNLSAESLEYDLSGMTKKEFINYKSGDDRLSKSFSGSVFTTGLLSGSSVLGPFIRGS